MSHQVPDSGDHQYYIDSHDRVPGPKGRPTDFFSSNDDRSRFQHSTSRAPDRPPPVPPKPTQGRHSRSMSHPFPSMPHVADAPPSSYFAPTKPSDERRDGRTMAWQMDGGLRKVGGVSGKDFATGHCMTCGGLVRWPSNLTVFKCTTCATVNDLEPLDGHDMPGATRRDGSASGATQKTADFGRGTYPAYCRSAADTDTLPAHVQPISLLHTKNLVRRCLQSHISRRLEESQGLHGKDRLWQSTSGQSHPSGSGTAVEGSAVPDSRRRFGTQFLNAPAGNTSSDSPRPMTKPQRSLSYGYSDKPALNHPAAGPSFGANRSSPGRSPSHEPQTIFKALEDYIAECFRSPDCLNSSFMLHNYSVGPEHQIRRKPVPSREIVPSREPVLRDARIQPRDRSRPRGNTDSSMPITQLDPKLLLLGDVAENGLWWTGSRPQAPTTAPKPKQPDHTRRVSSAAKPLQMDWSELDNWYRTIIGPAEGCHSVFTEISSTHSAVDLDLPTLENEFRQAQIHVHRTLLKHTEMLLKRPRYPISQPTDLRFLLIILENPLLHSSHLPMEGLAYRSGAGRRPQAIHQMNQADRSGAMPSSGPLSGQHSGIIKRLIGLISNSTPLCHNHLISWWIKFDKERYVKAKDLFSGFLTYRMLRQRNKKPVKGADEDAVTSFLIPQMRSGQSGAQIHDEIGALSLSNTSKKITEPEKITSYPDDWQVKATSRVLALIFAANDPGSTRDAHLPHQRGHKLPSSDFYVSMVDYIDLVKDFDTWEAKQGLFSFCQYPFLLSVWAKTAILGHDTRRQMQNKARAALIDSIMSNKSVQQYLTLTVRRECLVDDSLMAVSEVIGSGTDDIKKGLRIKFRGEEGIDGGGLRKEWFQLVIRDVFNPDFGMFLYDEDSHFCYFNPNSLESTDQYFLVGVVLGLAIYNSTILDVPLPPFAFKKLLAAAPGHGMTSLAHAPPHIKYTLDDLAEYRPRLARGLQQLLEYDGDVESTFALDFVVENDRYGSLSAIPLCDGGERRPVTNANRREYVDLYIRHELDTSEKLSY
ncbi:hect [Cordyceps fumosorosea ARSEF 2679]|uniref:HECT-type E3 ubiquitin transferase n=1 Tax=Cordyceps fumosorosea (strain ARSEF 2679) TaxID=1081104 RepID=A0A168BRT1_CORFA|nr:hect [Cordyceps fumosorosea ARSEF 2679]OAA70466.1 hect [Cordyceps fumosorosea ARSEF 2679]